MLLQAAVDVAFGRVQVQARVAVILVAVAVSGAGDAETVEGGIAAGIHAGWGGAVGAVEALFGASVFGSGWGSGRGVEGGRCRGGHGRLGS